MARKATTTKTTETKASQTLAEIITTAPAADLPAYIPETVLAADFGLRQIPGVAGAAARLSAALTRALDMKCRALAEIHMVGALKAETKFGADAEAVKTQVRAFLDIRWPTQRSGLGITVAAAIAAPAPVPAAVATVITVPEWERAVKARRAKAARKPATVATVDADEDLAIAYI